MPTWAFRPTGVCWDLPPEQAPPDCWTYATNATFPDGPATRPEGEARQAFASTSLTTLPVHVLHAGDDASNISAFQTTQVYWLVGTAVGGTTLIVQQWGDTGVSVATRTPASGFGNGVPGGANPVPANITGGRFNGLAYINVAGAATTSTGTSLAYGIPGGTTALTADIFSAGFNFRAARPYRYHMVGLAEYNPSGNDFGQRVRWSAAAAPGAWPATWAPAATNEAGAVEVADARGKLVDGGTLGDDFLIYAENSTHLMTYVGGQPVMLFRGVSTQAGILGRNCYADIGPAHFVVCDSDVVLMDARGPTSIADGLVRRHLLGPQGAIARGRAGWVHVIPHYARKEVWICYPADNTAWCSDALVWSMATGRWGHRTLTAAYRHLHGASVVTRRTDLRTHSEQATLVCGQGNGSALSDGRVYWADEPDLVTGWEARTSELRRWDLDLGEPGRVKRVRGVRVRIQDASGSNPSLGGTLEVRAGGRQSATDTIDWGPWQAVNPTTDGQGQTTGSSGRLVSVEVRHVGGTIPWRLVGLDIDFDLRGRW